MAACVALLAATPFTAPFPTCSLTSVLASPGVHTLATPPSGPVLAPAPDAATDYAPFTMTEEQFKQFKHSTVSASVQIAGFRRDVTPVTIAAIASPRTPDRTSLVLRL